MNPLQHLSSIGPGEWRSLHRRAAANGRGRVLHPDAERVAAVDELVALSVPELVRLDVLGLLADWGAERSALCASTLAGKAAVVLRLLDRALIAHGRDNGYPVAAWRDHAVRTAQIQAAVVSVLKTDDMPIGTIIQAAAAAVADVVVVLHHDRLGVPEALTDAVGSLLIVYGTDTTAA